MKSSRLALASFLGLSALMGFACDSGSDDAESACPIGSEGCECTSGGSCDGDLTCLSEVCVDASTLNGDGDDALGGSSGSDGDGGGDTSGDGDGDTSGDGDGDTSGDGDGDTSGDGGDGDESNPIACGSGQILCGEACVDPDTDDEYCGASGTCAGRQAGEACEDGYACEDGACKRQCMADEIACDDTCIDPATNSAYCGATEDCEGDNSGVACDETSECIDGSCRAPDGATCLSESDCISGTCSTFYLDQDADGFGAEASGITQICGTDAPDAGWVENALDCCDVAASAEIAALVNPDYAGGPGSEPAEGCADPFDYNCDGDITSDRPIALCSDFDAAACPPSVFNSEATLVCSELAPVLGCAVVTENDESICAQVAGTQTTFTCE